MYPCTVEHHLATPLVLVKEDLPPALLLDPEDDVRSVREEQFVLAQDAHDCMDFLLKPLVSAQVR